MMEDCSSLRAVLAVRKFDSGTKWGVAIEIDGRRNAVRVPDATDAMDALTKAAPILLEWATA